MTTSTANLETCPGCGVEAGARHGDGCDVARCLWTGMQRLACDGEWNRELSRWEAAA